MRKAEQIEKFKEGCEFLIQCFKEIKDKKDKYIWGLDISLSNTGLTVYKKNKHSSLSHKMKGERYQRLYTLEKSFEDHVLQFPPKLVLLEGYAFGSKQSREILGEASYAVKRCFTHRKGRGVFPCLTISPMSLKKFALNKTRGVSKKDLHKFVKNVWKADTKNDDESDSYVLSRIGESIYEFILNLKILIKTTKWGRKNKEEDWEDMFKNGFEDSDLEYYQWEVVRNTIMNDGVECKRFFN